MDIHIDSAKEWIKRKQDENEEEWCKKGNNRDFYKFETQYSMYRSLPINETQDAAERRKMKWIINDLVEYIDALRESLIEAEDEIRELKKDNGQKSRMPVLPLKK